MARNEAASRGLRDEANVGPAPRTAHELRRMSELKHFVVAAGEPDIRGWPVFSSTGRELGKVADLLVDADAGEVVMLDIDLRRSDRHTVAPIRAAWIDAPTKRVVVDAREVASEDVLPALPRSGTLSDDEMRRFNDDYVRAYGPRAVETDRSYRLRRGDEELRFGAVPLADAARADATRADATRADADRLERVDRDMRGDDRDTAPRRLLDPHDTTVRPAVPAPDPTGPYFRESERIDDIMATGATGAAAASATTGEQRRRDEMILEERLANERRLERDVADERERRVSRVDDASTLAGAQGIEPRELDARVRIDEGGTVDARTPVGGVSYPEGEAVPHDYGRPDERYGPEYGSGRIGFDHVVTRHVRAADEADVAPVDAGPTDPAAPRNVHYRRYDDRYEQR